VPAQPNTVASLQLAFRRSAPGRGDPRSFAGLGQSRRRGRMSQESKKILDLQARHLAKQGAESVEHLEVVITRARMLLETGEVVPQPDEQSPFVLKPYRWELSEPRRGGPKRLWLGTIEKLATGEGHTVYFLAGLAYDEDEFRRSISRE